MARVDTREAVMNWSNCRAAHALLSKFDPKNTIPRIYERPEYPPTKLAKRLRLVRSYIPRVICPVTKAIATACARVCAPSLPNAL